MHLAGSAFGCRQCCIQSRGDRGVVSESIVAFVILCSKSKRRNLPGYFSTPALKNSKYRVRSKAVPTQPADQDAKVTIRRRPV